METCGLIYVSGDYDKFLMRCSHCPTDVEVAQWQEFVLHFRNMHSSLALQEQEAIKDEVELKTEEMELEEFLLNEEAITEEAKIDTEIEALESSSNETEDSEDSGGSDQEAEPAEPPQENTDLDLALIYKFHPSFFRRDIRTLKFIEIYKAHPCLWNPEHNDYKEPRACSDALKQMLAALEATAAVVLNEISLKMAIKKLHTQFNIVHKRMLSGKQKPQSLAYSIYTLCSFLKSSREQEEAGRNGKIQLDFSRKNKLTTALIEMYANFPQLYDPTHKEFCSMSSRKQAYESLAMEISVPNVDVSSDDIFRAIQSLRQWYYITTKHAINAGNGAEKFYLEVCRFLPPKMFKQRLVCEICQHVTYSDHVLQAHFFKAHNIGELPFKCTQCDRSFIGRIGLANHMQRAHIGKTHKCTHCERAFAVPSDLQLHIRTHTGHKPYVCELCGKAFRLRSQLTLHVTAIHTKIRAFKCNMCPKDFVKKVDWSDHIKGHLNIRDKICIVCGKGFTSCHSLIRHRQIHSEVKKFVCKLCDARFSQFVGLNSHMKRTHNIVRSKQQKAPEAVDAENTVN